MTLTQLKYIVETAEAGTISKAAERLYISQPSLTAAIRELEHEFGITIFQRTNKGILLTTEGEEFLGYARQVITQTRLMEERYAEQRRCATSSVYPPSIIPLQWRRLWSC